MSEDRSLVLYGIAKTAENKLDYFSLGIISALLAYIGQTNQHAVIALNLSAISTLSLFALLIAFVSGFMRLEYSLMLIQVNEKSLHASESIGAIKAAAAGDIINRENGKITLAADRARVCASNEALVAALEKKLRGLESKALRSYKIRNWAFIAGMILYVIGKIT